MGPARYVIIGYHIPSIGLPYKEVSKRLCIARALPIPRKVGERTSISETSPPLNAEPVKQPPFHAGSPASPLMPSIDEATQGVIEHIASGLSPVYRAIRSYYIHSASFRMRSKVRARTKLIGVPFRTATASSACLPVIPWYLPWYLARRIAASICSSVAPPPQLHGAVGPEGPLWTEQSLACGPSFTQSRH